jgi:hypothetical protein
MTSEFDKIVKNLTKKYGKSEVNSGLDVEKEHNDVTHGNKADIAKITKAHLDEEPLYYKKLKKYVEN